MSVKLTVDRITPDIKYDDKGNITWTPRLVDYNVAQYPAGHVVTSNEFNTEFLKMVYQGNYLTDTITVLTTLYNALQSNVKQTAESAASDAATALTKATTAENNSVTAVNTANSALSIIEDAAADAQAAVNAATNAVTTAENAINTAEADIDKLESSVSTLQETVGVNTSNISDLQRDLGTANSNIAQNTADIVSNSNAINEINEKIPTQASQNNQLADKDFVNSSINNLAAFYITKNAQRDAFETHAELFSATVFYSGGQPRTPTRNDYCIVRSDEEHENATTRYMYDVNGWAFQYIVNETPLTAAQVAAINSGITEALVQQIGENTSARHTHTNKSLLDTYSQTEANLSDAVAKKHSHSNKSTLDATTASFTTEQQTKLAGIAEGANKTVVDSALSSTSTNPVQNKVVDSAIKAVTNALDNKVTIEAGKGLSSNDFTDTYKNKIDGIETGAQVNTVTSVNNKTGAVNLTASDVGALPSSTTIPTVNNGKLTIRKNGTDVGSFTANQSSDTIVNIKVPTTASDVGALPDTTDYLKSATVSNNELIITKQDDTSITFQGGGMKLWRYTD